MIDQAAAEKIFNADVSNIVRKVKAGKPLTASERKIIDAETTRADTKPATTETPARPGTITAESLCALTGYTDRRHRQLAKAGWFPAPYRSQYQADKTKDGLIKYLLERINTRSDTEKVLKVQTAEVNLEIAKAELATVQDLTIPKKTIGPALRNLCLHQRSLFQRKLEQELAPKLSGLTPLEISASMSAAVDDICAVFFDGVRAWLETDSAPAAAKSGTDIPGQSLCTKSVLEISNPATPASPAAVSPAKKSRLKKPLADPPRKSDVAKQDAGVPS